MWIGICRAIKATSELDAAALIEQKRDFPDFYMTSPQPCPYLPGRRERKVFTHLSADKPLGVVDHLLRTGFRRSQRVAYTPHCEGCNACVSVRVVVDDFAPGRTFRRTLKRNRDMVARRLAPAPTSEQYTLFRDYIATRHGEGGMTDMSSLDYAMMVQDSMPKTQLTEYRRRQPLGLASEFDNWPLLGVALSDRLSDGLSLVYSFYDTDDAGRSLGTYIILEQIRDRKSVG